METIYIALIIVFVVILLWLTFSRSTKTRCLSELNGLWMADEEFCNESGIELMTIFFGDKPGEPAGNKLCWILLLNDSGQYNHITVAKFSEGKPLKGEQYEFDLELEDVADDIFSTNLKIRIVPGELITVIDSETDAKIFEGMKNKNASDAINFDINEAP